MALRTVWRGSRVYKGSGVSLPAVNPSWTTGWVTQASHLTPQRLRFVTRKLRVSLCDYKLDEVC